MLLINLHVSLFGNSLNNRQHFMIYLSQFKMGHKTVVGPSTLNVSLGIKFYVFIELCNHNNLFPHP